MIKTLINHLLRNPIKRDIEFISNGIAKIYSNPCRSRKIFTPPQPSPMPWGGSKKFTNDLGLLYYHQHKIAKFSKSVASPH
jgi:hypothetical protein